MPGRRARGRLMGGRGRGKRSFKKKMIRRIDTLKHQAKSLLVWNEAPTTLSTKVLWDNPITGILQGDTRDQRERNSIWISGIRLRMTFRNSLKVPMYCHVALINPRDPFPDDGSDANALNPAGFFTALGTSSRSGYPAAHSAQQLTGMQWATLPINTDVHNIIWHTRFKLGIRFDAANQEFTTGAGAPNYRTLSRYIKIGKTVGYKNTAGNSCLQPMYLVVWCSTFEEPLANQTAGALIFQPHIVTYFKDPKK